MKCAKNRSPCLKSMSLHVLGQKSVLYLSFGGRTVSCWSAWSEHPDIFTEQTEQLELYLK